MTQSELIKLLPTGDETRGDLAYKLRMILKHLIEKVEAEPAVQEPKTAPKEHRKQPNALHDYQITHSVAGDDSVMDLGGHSGKSSKLADKFKSFRDK